jgi:hypothetical protein
MRTGLALALLLALGGAAAADSPRYRPALGTTATFRLLVTVAMSGYSESFGQIYRVKVTSDDGAIVEGSLTPLAAVWRCPDGDTSTACKQAQSIPNARRENDLVVAPLPADVSSALGKIGRVAIRDILHVMQVFPLAGLRDASDTVRPEIGATPVSVQSTALDCDEAALRPFFPFGAVAQVSVPCKMTVEMTQSRIAGAKDGKYSQDVTYDLSFAGHEHVVVPAGAYEVAVIKFKSTAGVTAGAVTEGEWEFIESLGLSARFSALTRMPNSTNTTHIVRELIKVEP